jgi:carboxylesterase
VGERDNADSTPLLLSHGLLSTPREFGLIAGRLRAGGIKHQALEIPGYTLACRGWRRTSWREWVESASACIDAAADRDRPVMLGGLCTGGLISAAIALQRRRRIDGLVLISPTLAYDGWGLSRWRHLRHLGYWLGVDRFIRIREREPYGIKNPVVRRWIAREMRDRACSAAGPAALPLWALGESEKLTAYVCQRVHELDCPTMIIHARDDEITQLRHVRAFFDALTVPEKRFVVLENSYHVVTMDNDHARVAEELAAFVRSAKRIAVLSARIDPLPVQRLRVAS